MDSPQIQPGAALPTLTRAVSQETIRRYAEASGDFNPMHLDEECAARSPFGGIVAHGMLVMAYASELLTAAFGMDWLNGGRLRVRFRGAARPGDIVTVSGQVRQVTPQPDGRRRVECQVQCRNQRDEILINGDAEVALEGLAAEVKAKR